MPEAPGSLELKRIKHRVSILEAKAHRTSRELRHVSAGPGNFLRTTLRDHLRMSDFEAGDWSTGLVLERNPQLRLVEPRRRSRLLHRKRGVEVDDQFRTGENQRTRDEGRALRAGHQSDPAVLRQRA